MNGYQPGTVVEGAIRVHGKEYEYRGRVAWAIAGSPRLNVPGRMGVSFSSVSPEFLRALDGLAATARPTAVTRPPERAKKR